jgi:hypothetical protein
MLRGIEGRGALRGADGRNPGDGVSRRLVPKDFGVLLPPGVANCESL